MRDTPDTAMPAASAFPGELMIWLSASFPVGGFAYSQGLETAVERGWVKNRTCLETWLSALLAHGALWNDLVLVSLTVRAENERALVELVELAAALQPSAERYAETTVQGRSFVAAYEAAWCVARPSPYAGMRVLTLPMLTLPVALGIAARHHVLELEATLQAYAIAYCNTLISAAIRLSVIGQFDGQRILAALLAHIRQTCGRAQSATIDDLGSATFGADLASMLHETQTIRLFRS